MLVDHEEYEVVVTAVAPVGAMVRTAAGDEGFVDRAKHPSWWSPTPRAAVGDRMRAVVLDASRTPAPLSALADDVRIARSLRHTTPLTRLCPPPGEAASVEWGPVEESLGLALSADYRHLVERYGGGLFADTVWLLSPGCPDPFYDLVGQCAERAEDLADLWDAGEDRPDGLRDGDRLVPWGYVEGAGHVLYWLVRPGTEPEEWPVLLNEGRGPLWEFHPPLCSRFLLDVVAGTTTSYYFTDLDELVTPAERTRFLPLARIPGP
ncbi:hypothetical protein [Streptomyces sp. NPDC090298]|uniref:hypothetical protein n=1 Tax=Streptomyces sp. NPDC090298 TaxID=3365959 RepID=UPI0037F6D728